MVSVRRIVILTCCAAAAFWLIDAMLDAWAFGEGTFAQQALRPDLHESYVRLLAISFMAVAGAAWSRQARRSLDGRRELAISEANYRALVEASPDCVVVHAGGRPLFANRRTLEFVGVPDIETLSGETIDSFLHPDDRALVAERLGQLLSGEADIVPAEVRIRRGDGTYAEVLGHSSTIRYGDRLGILSAFRDVTADMETRRELLAGRERLSLALEAAQDGVWDWDLPSGRMVYSRSWATMLGLELEDVAPDQSTWERLVHPDDRLRAAALLQAHLRGEVPVYETETRLRHARGHYIWVLDRGKVVRRDAAGEPLRMTGTHRDITDRKEAELALEVRNRLAETFLTGSGPDIYIDALAVVCEATGSPAGLLGTFDGDGDLRVAAARPASEAPFIPADGLPPLLARVSRLDHAVVESGPVDLDGSGRTVQGAVAVPISTRDQVLGVLVVADRPEAYLAADRAFLESLSGYLAPIMQSHLANEITEAQLRQAQKMEALGALAGGIAHDFNNILQAILGFTSLARGEAAAGSTIARDLDRVLKAARRGEELVRRILLFSRREGQEVRPVDASVIAQEAVDLLAPTLPATIALEADIAPDGGLIVADPSQISQMLLNLATNAVHAMEDGGGTLRVRLRRLPAGSSPTVPPALADRELVRITVADTGCGMDRATLARLFDPFFTTKAVGKGTGLGLSVVHGIVTAHGGDIRVASDPGQGTVVDVYLPRQPDAPLPIDGDGTGRADRRILFVDDEEPIVNVATTMLERGGYAVTGCVGGSGALELLAQGARDYDLLVTDAAMPGTDGAAVIARWRELRPGAPVVVITGHNEASVPEAARTGGHTAVIRKPFGTDALRSAVQDALAAAVPGKP